MTERPNGSQRTEFTERIRRARGAGLCSDRGHTAVGGLKTSESIGKWIFGKNGAVGFIRRDFCALSETTAGSAIGRCSVRGNTASSFPMI